MKKITVSMFLLLYTLSWAQDQYKYVIVPNRFTFFKEENKYNLNTVTKSFFEKEGFIVYYDTDEFPVSIANNRCEALYANAVESNTIFTTKITIEIKDCYNKVIFTSDLGASKDKSYETAYTAAFRQALSSMKQKLNFKKTSTTKEVLPTPAAEFVASPAPASVKTTTDVLLFAIPTEIGYKLVDSVPAIIFELAATSIEHVFTAKKGALTGTFLKKNSGWFFEYYDDTTLISEKVLVKF